MAKLDFDCEANIRFLVEERISRTLSKMFLLFSSSFLSRTPEKKNVEEQTFLGFVSLI